MTFICQDCANKQHSLCRGGTYCDCQHRPPQPSKENPS